MPTSPRRSARPIDLETIAQQLAALAGRVEELHALVSRLTGEAGAASTPLLDAEVVVGEQVLTKVTGQMIAVDVLEAVKVAGKMQYRLQRVDNGRALNSLRPSSTLYRLPAER